LRLAIIKQLTARSLLVERNEWLGYYWEICPCYELKYEALQRVANE
jgi:hypothetical protein